MLKLVCIAGVAALTCSATWSDSLRLLTDERAVSSGGTASTTTSRTYFDGSSFEPVVVQDAQPATSVQHPSNGFGLFNQSKGLGLRTPAATVDGQGYQVSTIDPHGFEFHGVADVLVSASRLDDYQMDYAETTEGNAFGHTSVSLSWTFAMDTGQTWRFTGDHNLYDARGGLGSYTLTGNNGFVWDDQGESSCSTVLQLAPGTYTFSVNLQAFALESYQGEAAGRAQANFALTAVPEPASLALLVPGLLLVAGLAHLRRGSVPANHSPH